MSNYFPEYISGIKNGIRNGRITGDILHALKDKYGFYLGGHRNSFVIRDNTRDLNNLERVLISNRIAFFHVQRYLNWARDLERA